MKTVSSVARVVRTWSVVFVMVTVAFGGFFVALNAQAVVSVVTLTSPVGGENWSGVHNITWTTTSDPGDLVDIIYSVNDFATTRLIATSILASDGAYAWNTASAIDGDQTTYKVRVVSHLNPLIHDTSAAFTVDNSAPTFTVNDGTSIAPVQNDTINVTVDATVSGLSAAQYNFSADTTCNAADFPGIPFTSGVGFVIAGNHTDYLCVNATDNAGNVGYQFVGQLNTDNTDPTFTVVGTTVQGNNDTIVLSFSEPVSASDGLWDANEFADVESPNGTNLDLTGAVFLYSGNNLTITLDEANEFLKNGDEVAVTPALNAIQDAASNSVANLEVLSAAISGDVTAPTVALSYNPDRPVKDADTVTITATFNELLDGTPQIEGTGHGAFGPAAMTSTLNPLVWTYSWDVPAGDGTTTFVIATEDHAGNLNVAATNATRTVDNTLPTIVSVTSTTPDGPYNNPDAINITVTFSESVTSTGQVTVTLNTGGSCSFSVSDATTGSCTYTVADGENTPDLDATSIVGVVEDRALNGMVDFTPVTNLAAGHAIVVDTTEPVISVVTLAAGLSCTGDLCGIGDTITLNVTADAAGYVPSAVTVNGEVVVLVDNSGGSYSGIYTIASGDTDAAAGTISVTVTLTDAAGNFDTELAVTAANTVAVDANAPAAPSITAIAGDNYINNAEQAAVVVTGTAEADSLVTVELSDGGTTVSNTGVAVAGNFSISLDVTLLNDGTITPTVTATDAAGNVSVADMTPTATKDVLFPVIQPGGIIGTTKQALNDTIFVSFNEQVVPVDGTWSANEFTSIESPDGTSKTLAGATFSPVSGAASIITITFAEDPTDPATYLRNGNKVAVTPNAAAVQDLAGNVLTAGEVVSLANVGGDVAAPGVALAYAPDRTLVGQETVLITATFNEAIHETVVPTIAITTPGDGDVTTVGMTRVSNTEWTYSWQTPGGLDDEGISTVTITATDLAGNANTTALNNTRVIDTQAALITSFTVGSITSASATLSATTNEAAVCKYAQANLDFGAMASMSVTGTTAHSTNVSGLTPATLYFFYVRCQDVSTNISPSELVLFTTAAAPDLTAPPAPVISTGPATTKNSTFNLSGTAGADTPVNGVRILRVYNGTTLSETLILPAAQTNWSAVVALNPNTTNSFTATSADSSGNTSAASGAVVITNNVDADETGPVITNIQTGVITQTGATITWTTNENSSSVVEYGTTSSYGSQATTPGTVTSHSVNLIGLTADTEYHFRVKSTDAALNQTVSVDGTFTTVAPATELIAPPAPVITTSAFTTVASSAAIFGTAGPDTPADSVRTVRVYVGATVAATTTLQVGQTAWSAVVALNPNTANSITAKSTDASGNTSGVSNTVVITNNVGTDTTNPIITDVHVTSLTSVSANINWDTNEQSNTVVEFGPTAAYGTTTTTNNSVFNHLKSLTGLTPGVTYHYRVKSTDASGNTGVSSDHVFTTLPAANPAVVPGVTNVTAIKTFATADNTYANGWEWVFDMTLPVGESSVSMKFADWVSGGNTLPVAGNMRFFSEQSSNADTEGTAITIGSANAYAGPMHLDTDLDLTRVGVQLRIHVQVKVPNGTAAGSYSTSYGFRSTTP